MNNDIIKKIEIDNNRLKRLVDLQDEYIKLKEEELKECRIFAIIHGWSDNNNKQEQNIELQNKIEFLKRQDNDDN